MRLLFSILLLVLQIAAPAGAACRQALVVALDISSSVDTDEYELQMKGLAGALQDPEVRSLILSQPSAPLSLAVFEWSGRNDQRLVVNWTAIDSEATLNNIAATLVAQSRPGGTATTAIGNALSYAGQLLEMGPDCWKQTIDISGDGKNNDGYRPQIGKSRPVFDSTTVNALVIARAPGSERSDDETADLVAYFQQEVIHGPDAFTETALGFQEYQAAMTRKLLREMSLSFVEFPARRLEFSALHSERRVVDR